MGFFDILSSIAGGLINEAQNQQNEALKKAGKQVADYEKKVSKAESNSGSMSYEQQIKIKEAREKVDRNKAILKDKGISNIKVMSTGASNSFEKVKASAPNHIGIYVMTYNGKVMYVGRAIEDRPDQSTKGLRKRLQEHWRGANVGKKELYEHRYEILVDLKLCSSVEEARALEATLIRQYDTVINGWNLRYED